jgi:hypothetical protein
MNWVMDVIGRWFTPAQAPILTLILSENWCRFAGTQRIEAERRPQTVYPASLSP